MDIGSKIKFYRKKQGLTQLQLASKANISRSYLADVEKNRYNPSIETLKDIANALEVSLNDFFDDKVVESEIDDSIEFVVPKEYSDKYKVTSRDKKQYLEEMKKANEAFFMNDDFNEEAKKEMLDLMAELFWDAKAKNKRKK